jgi:hypothetical protein
MVVAGQWPPKHPEKDGTLTVTLSSMRRKAKSTAFLRWWIRVMRVRKGLAAASIADFSYGELASPTSKRKNGGGVLEYTGVKIITAHRVQLVQ